MGAIIIPATAPTTDARPQPSASILCPTRDPHEAARLRVELGHGAQGEAERRETEERVEGAEHHQRDADHPELVRAQVVIAEERLGGERAREGAGGVSEDPSRHAVEDHHEPDEDHHHRERGGVHGGADDDALDEDSHRERHDERRDKREPVEETPASVIAQADVRGAQSELALGEVHEARDPVDHDQRERQARVNRATGEAGKYLVKQRLHSVSSVPEVRAPERLVGAELRGGTIEDHPAHLEEIDAVRQVERDRRVSAPDGEGRPRARPR